jgi:hypothetical protein
MAKYLLLPAHGFARIGRCRRASGVQAMRGGSGSVTMHHDARRQ